ncbi:MAG: bifunctional phosphoribosyl-AMP cyclohydrolase/phosphoribosyl-ATP diphosphatase HisIE [Candidatus Dadabacteria bacterium]|nr:bifunctional phosphoribosyl-AMP cyclohydrolase/phosphoribosyl-ATP diphosphatase HisIE [Candidatus Dadabacteria bacterium]
MNFEQLKFDDNGLIPVIIQDYNSGQVLMLAYANKEALEKTIETKKTHFWSRSRKKLWNKGEESGNFQEVKDIFYDCDKDTILITVLQKGVTCHTGEQSCFYTNIENKPQLAPTFSSDMAAKVFEVIEDRKKNPKEGSYVNSLFEGGLDRILKKIGEEAGEAIIAAKNKDSKELIYELTDLWFHSLILLSNEGLSPDEISKELEKRFGKPKSEYSD